MSINQLFLLTSFTFYFSSSFAGGDNPIIGARSSGIGNASVTLTDPWQIINNVSGIASIKNISTGFAFENRFGIKSLDRIAAIFICPTKFGVPGISFYKFGDQNYNEEMAGIGFAHQIMKVSLGIKVNYLQMAMSELRSRHSLVFEFGGIAEITPQLFFAAHVYNINQAKIKGYQTEYIPTIMKTGFSYRPLKKLMINVETEKDVDFKPTFKAGIEYFFIDNFCVRTGFSTYPSSGSLGIGINKKNFYLDYSCSSHARLGFINQISFYYKINKG